MLEYQIFFNSFLRRRKILWSLGDSTIFKDWSKLGKLKYNMMIFTYHIIPNNELNQGIHKWLFGVLGHSSLASSSPSSLLICSNADGAVISIPISEQALVHACKWSLIKCFLRFETPVPLQKLATWWCWSSSWAVLRRKCKHLQWNFQIFDTHMQNWQTLTTASLAPFPLPLLPWVSPSLFSKNFHTSCAPPFPFPFPFFAAGDPSDSFDSLKDKCSIWEDSPVVGESSSEPCEYSGSAIRDGGGGCFWSCFLRGVSNNLAVLDSDVGLVGESITTGSS